MYYRKRSKSIVYLLSLPPKETVLKRKNMEKITKEFIERALKGYNPQEREDSDRIPSAVLVPLLEQKGRLHLLFMRKAEDGSLHGGQVSFPGGAYEEKDGDILTTALRETQEELGIAPSLWDILGRLDPVETKGSSYVIHPFVAYLERKTPFRPNPQEVASIFTVPLNYILECHPFKTQELQWRRKNYTTFIITYRGETIWGATARILDRFCNIIKETSSSGAKPRKAKPR